MTVSFSISARSFDSYARDLHRKRLVPNTSWQAHALRRQGTLCLPLFLSYLNTSLTLKGAMIESSAQRSPSPSKKSGRSSPANSQRRSSSSKRKCSLENTIEEVPRGNEHETHDVRDNAMNPIDKSSSPPNLPGSPNPVHSTSPSPQGSVVPQPNSTPEAQVPTAATPHAGSAMANAEVEEEEGLTEVERSCRKEEKDYPDIVLKPEEVNAWPELSDTLTKHDGDQSQAHYQNIDTLLVLSGLFSAVVTTLLIEANQRLQQDPADTTVQLLLQISMQLSSLSVNSGFVNSTFVPPTSLAFSPEPSAVVISILWSMSLVISLVTASLGMLVKQWLREYHSKANVSPEKCCQIRTFRAPGLRKYKVAEIADFLPILLQIALILFFVGLILSYRSIHTSIAVVVSILITIWLSFVVGTTLLPILSPSCPYKTPLLKSIFLQFRGFLERQRKRIDESPIKSYFHFLPTPLFIEEPTDTKEMDNKTKIKVLMSAYETFQDIKSWDIVMRCVDLTSPLESLRMLTTLVEQKYKSKITSNSDVRGLFDQAQLRLLLKSMTACLRRASFAALKGGGDAWFTSTDVAHFVTLQRLCYAFRSSGGSDTALANIVNRLTQHEHVLSVPHHPDFTALYSVLQQRVSLSLFPERINFYQMRDIIACTSGALDSSSGTSARFKPSQLRRLLEMCRISFLCAGRTTQEVLYMCKSKFLQLTVRLAESLQSISYPENDVEPEDVFRVQCALDMAMRLHTKVPGFVDKSLFQALHVYSVKVFDVAVEKWPPFVMKSHIRKRNDALSTGEVPSSVPEADWEEVLHGKGKEYVGFRISDDGNDRYEWYHEDLQSSCKQRMGLLWSKLSENLFFENGKFRRYKIVFRSILDELEIEPRIPLSK